MRISRFLLIIAVIIVLGVSLAGQGIEGVVGEGSWKVLNYSPIPNGVRIEILGKGYLVDYRPLHQAKEQSMKILITNVKAKGDLLWSHGKNIVIKIWEDTQNNVARLTAE